MSADVAGMLVLLAGCGIALWFGHRVAHLPDRIDADDRRPEYVEVGRIVWADGRPHYVVGQYPSPVAEAEELLRGMGG